MDNNINFYSDETREGILNTAYALSMEFGEGWLQPIDERLGKIYPQLDSRQLSGFNNICQQLRTEATNFICQRLEQITDSQLMITEKDLGSELSRWMTEHYPWVSKSNIRKALAQGLYYAWRDGLTECVK
ncbi:MAG: hypothetical protein RIB71_06605 [Imperialibacter sp.]|uniref:hypothetical protein n=1 Tax=Imperialibacter sp. TaxID=2038411 RepID=UPI0032EABF6E